MKKLLFILSFLVASTSYAQEVIGDSLRIADTKAGKVASILKKNGNGIKKVCITGQINAKDLQALATVPGLTTLDLSGAVYMAQSLFGSSAICEMPNFSSLSILKCPKIGIFNKEEQERLDVRLESAPRLISLRPNVSISKSDNSKLSGELGVNEVELDMTNSNGVENTNCIKSGNAKVVYVVGGSLEDAYQYVSDAVIICNQNKDRVLLNGEWDSSLDERWLALITDLGVNADFSKYYKSHLSLPKIKVFPIGRSNCGIKYCKQIKSLDVPSIVSFNALAIYDSGVKNLTFPESLRELTISQDSYVENIDTIRLLGSTPPQLTYPVDPSKKQKVVFIVPDGAKKKYKNAPSWKGVIVQEVNGGGATIDPSKSYNIKVEKPGTILSYLPVDKLDEIEAVTITGILYETDLKALSDCKNLISVDLSNTYICFSPEALKEKKANAEMFAGFARAMGAIADMKYDDFNMTTPDYVYAKLFTKLVEEGANTKEPEVKCIMPKGAFRNCLSLESIKFPTRCVVIEKEVCDGCSELKEVVLPPYLEEIHTGAFAHCRSLEEVKIPNTLKYMGTRTRTSLGKVSAFAYSGIKVLDLSKCVFKETEWTCDLMGSKNLKELRFPKNITFVDDLSTNKGAHYYFSDTEVSFHHSISFYNMSLHFRHSTPPSLNSVSETTFYIPKGATTAYYAKFGKNNKYIEE